MYVVSRVLLLLLCLQVSIEYLPSSAAVLIILGPKKKVDKFLVVGESLGGRGGSPRHPCMTP